MSFSKRDPRYVCTYVYSENRSLIQSLALMHSAIIHATNSHAVPWIAQVCRLGRSTYCGQIEHATGTSYVTVDAQQLATKKCRGYIKHHRNVCMQYMYSTYYRYIADHTSVICANKIPAQWVLLVVFFGICNTFPHSLMATAELEDIQRRRPR